MSFPDRQCATPLWPLQSIGFVVRSKNIYCYWSTEGPLTPAGNSTRSKMFFAISRWRKICPRASILLSYHVVKTRPIIPALLVVTGSWSVARKYAVFVVTNARMGTRSREMARLYEPNIDSILAKNVYTVVTHAERNVLAVTNIQIGAWKIVDSPASMQSVIYVVRSPVLLVRNHADGQHSFFSIDYISFLILLQELRPLLLSCPMWFGQLKQYFRLLSVINLSHIDMCTIAVRQTLQEISEVWPSMPIWCVIYRRDNNI